MVEASPPVPTDSLLAVENTNLLTQATSQRAPRSKQNTQGSPGSKSRMTSDKQAALEAKVAEKMYRLVFDVKSDPKAKRPPLTELGQ